MRRLAAVMVLSSLAAFGAMSPVDEASYARLVAASKGKVVLVNFWATYCVPCRAEMPALVKLSEKLKARGFVFITVSADEPEQEADAASFIRKAGVAAPHYIKRAKDDEKFINLVEPKWSGALPASFLYDRTGKKVKTFIGEADLKALEAAIAKLL
ncbi:MAG: TlpA disulfide reductase family protein [Bryobacteraceae bacterium]|nr:TlpA disulfide reductase family protein [Bryobacteraceae bacterium]